MANKWGNSGNSDRLYFGGLQNHCRWWLQPWNKSFLLLGRKFMTNLDSILKSRDISLPTKIHLVKAVVFPVVMCTDVRIRSLRKLGTKELILLNCGVGEDSWETARRSNQSILKQINLEYSLEWLMLKLKLQYLWSLDAKKNIEKESFPDAGKDWRQEEKGMTEDKMVEWHHIPDGHDFEQALGVGDGQGSLACCSPWGCKE